MITFMLEFLYLSQVMAWEHRNPRGKSIILTFILNWVRTVTTVGTKFLSFNVRF